MNQSVDTGPDVVEIHHDRLVLLERPRTHHWLLRVALQGHDVWILSVQANMKQTIDSGGQCLTFRIPGVKGKKHYRRLYKELLDKAGIIHA